jgi:hypothetical protein
MDFPIHPFVCRNKHADSAVRKCQESVREPDDYLSAGSPPLDKHWCAILHGLLKLIYSNTIHQPRNDSLNQFNHRRE